MKRVLVLAPHTDDGELGCGASIAKFIEEKNELYYVAFSTCRRSLPAGWKEDTLEKEVKNATGVLGIPASNLILYDYDVRKFKDERQGILEDLVQLRQQIHPDLVLVPSPTDIHQDHQVISDEGLRAFKTTSILGYEMPWNNVTFNTRAFIPLQERHLEIKVKALEEYRSQLHKSYASREFIYSLASVRGIQMGTTYAEAFEVIRLIL